MKRILFGLYFLLIYDTGYQAKQGFQPLLPNAQSSLVAGFQKPKSISELIKDFATGYQKLGIPQISYNYLDYFKRIPALDTLTKQQHFFLRQQQNLRPFLHLKLSLKETIERNHLNYEININLQRISLEMEWIADGRQTPVNGLHELKNHEAWYRFFIQRYTSLPLTADEIMNLGIREVSRVQQEINRIQQQAGFKDSVMFYAYLKKDTFLLKDKQAVVRAFERTDSIIRKNLPAFVGPVEIPQVHAVEWPNADANTPPGIYLNAQYSPSRKNIFQYNFYGGHYNRRAIDWLYMHEAIPGHHLQATLRSADSQDDLQRLFNYPGNFEGWACYVEYYGKELGLYTDLFSELGKWEWDLVRSARLILDAGIHQYGWSHQHALTYWQQAVPGQDQIAEREISRVTNWTAQALSYKVGADCIEQLRQKMRAKYGLRFDERRFHRTYLSFGMRPLQVIKQSFDAAYAENANS